MSWGNGVLLADLSLQPPDLQLAVAVVLKDLLSPFDSGSLVRNNRTCAVRTGLADLGLSIFPALYNSVYTCR
jgi:hypothetical protein